MDWSEYFSAVEYFRHPNVVALRTFSKIYGLAGVRLGYGVMDAQLVAYLQRTRMPFNLTIPAQGPGWRRWTTRSTCGARARPTSRAAPTTRRSSGGCILARAMPTSCWQTLDGRVGGLPEKLLAGVIVRPWRATATHSLRISVGTREENQRCVAALKEILAS